MKLFGSKNHRNSHHAYHKHFAKKKFSFFYKINFFVALFVSLILLYFIILVSAEPKSFPYFTKKIEAYFKENLGTDVSMDTPLISFTPYGSFKITIKNLKMNKSDVANENHESIIPIIEGEFPLYNTLLLRFSPTKIRIINPEITLQFLKKSAEIDADIVPSGQEISASTYSTPIINFLAAIESKKIYVKFFEIENAKLTIKRDNKTDLILLKKSQIRLNTKSGDDDNVLQILSSNSVNFNGSKDINLNANCKFNKKSSTLCNLVLNNLATSAIANLSPSLDVLNQIDTTVNATAALLIKNHEFHNLTFKVDAKSGAFDLPKFFSNKIFFNNLSVYGDYNNISDTLNLSEIKAGLTPENYAKNIITALGSSAPEHLAMSLVVTGLQNTNNQKSDFYIKLENIPTEELDSFWPVSLPGQEIRHWVINHINGGNINNAYAKFSLHAHDGVTDLQNLNSEVVFDGLNLNYDEYFPKISALKGVASFTHEKMNIAISSGNVLESKVSNAQVSINNFADHINILNISGNIAGKASDGIKHANYKSVFATEIEKYLNGTGQGIFDIKIPLQEKITLADLYISANNKIENLANDYLQGSINISAKKNFNSDDFITSIDLTSANVSAKAFDIEKKLNSNGGLDFILSIIGDDKIELKNINLWKKEELVEKKKPITVEAKISGNMLFETAPFKLAVLNLRNINFGKNDYAFSYQNIAGKNSAKISLTGKYFNLTSFLQNKLPTSSGENPTRLALKVALDKIFLINNKSLKNASANISYNNGIYSNGSAKATYGKQQSASLVTTKKPAENFSTISGTITDIGYLAEGLGIADTISSGNTKINIVNTALKNNPILKGKVEIDNEITIYESNTTKRLASNSLFSTVQDKIFSNNKTIFDTVKVEFNFAKNNLEIESLIANNYKIGITAKGFVNLSDGSYNIKGMIIPGFVINNLFGIGNIPLIGGVISGLLTGGEGGGLFGIKYEYKKLAGQKDPTFETDKVSAFVPVSIRNLFDFL